MSLKATITIGILALTNWSFQIQAKDVEKAFWRTIKTHCPTIPTLDGPSIEMDEKIEAGGTGVVFQGNYTFPNGKKKTFAVKQIRLGDDEKAISAAREFCTTFKFHDKADHVVKVIAVAYSNAYPAPVAMMAMPRYDGNLLQVVSDIRQRPWTSEYAKWIYGKKLPSKRSQAPDSVLLLSPDIAPKWMSWLRKVLRHVALAVSEVHSKRIMHLDIKPENILVRTPLTQTTSSTSSELIPSIILSDFELARDASANQFAEKWTQFGIWMRRRDGRVGTVHYMAPELLSPLKEAIEKKWGSIDGAVREYMKATATVKKDMEWFLYRSGTVAYPTMSCDIYSLGVLFYQVAIGSFPFDIPPNWTDSSNGQEFKIDSTNIMARMFLLNNRDQVPTCKQTDPTLCELIRSMLHPNPKKRPEIKHVLQHPFLKGYSK